MADGPYRHYSAGTGQQQQFYYQHNQQTHPRQLTRNGSPIGSGRSPYNNETPSPSRSPVSQGSSHPFGMFKQGQGQISVMNGGNGHQRYMQMNVGHTYPQSAHQPHHNQQGHHHQQSHTGPSGHGGLGHQHTFSGGMNINSSQAYSTTLQNGSLNDDPNEIGEPMPEHWKHQLQLAAELRQTNQTSHRHSRKGGATLASRGGAQDGPEDPLREGEQTERNRVITMDEDPRQDWDGMDMSGQGLRCLAIRLFRDYSFLTKLFVDNNKICELPPAISSLRNLTHLQASGNQLRGLPDSIGMLSKLEQLLVFDNHIQMLPSEIGYLSKLEILGIEGNPLEDDTKEFLVQHGTSALVTHLRDSTEAGVPPRKRPRVVLDDSEAGEKFTVLDYNILCDKYASRSLYSYTPTKALQWEYRRDLILEEIKHHDADFVCLQEIDQENYHDFFRRELAFYHYKGIFWPKSRARTMSEREAKLVDGCAIFYKGPKFIMLDKQLIDFGNIAINRPDMKGEHDIFNRVMPRDHIAVVAFFENRMTGSRMVVANAHLHWDPRFTDVILVQTAILMDQVTKFADKWSKLPPCTDKAIFRHTEQDLELESELSDTPPSEPGPSLQYSSGSQLPLIVCGDFNSSKGSGVYELLSRGSVAHDHPDLGNRSYGTFTREGMSHPFRLRSAYHGEPTDYIEFTNYTPGFSGHIDYIWYSTSLRRRQLLGNVDFDYLQKVPGFPNFHFPSDHLPLFAEFSVEQRKERSKPTEADFGSHRDHRK